MGDEVREGVDGWRARLVAALESDRSEEEPGDWLPGVSDHRKEVLAFCLGKETYGVEITRVAEILVPRPVTPLPRAPSFVRGIASLRGTVLPVLDLASRLGVPGGTIGRANRILVVRDEDEIFGFWVDRVRGVIRFKTGELEGGEYAATVDPQYLEDIGYEPDGTLVALLNVGALCIIEPEEL